MSDNTTVIDELEKPVDATQDDTAENKENKQAVIPEKTDDKQKTKKEVYNAKK